jgi:hypothetical protein
MPKVERTKPLDVPALQALDLEKPEAMHAGYKYVCECGCEVVFYTSAPPKRLPKCFKCGKTLELE